MDPPVAPVGGQAPEVPVAIPGLQETLAQFLSMVGTLAQAGLVPVAPTTSRTTGGAQSHTLSVVLVQPVIAVYLGIRPETSEEEHKRLARFMKYDPPTFNGAVTDNSQGFLDKCHHILRTMGIVEKTCTRGDECVYGLICGYYDIVNAER
ncbi:uncharacterized protein LOC107773305 [Nicotiana tabacum]|uniref:Uncharacterized protein LOC107773305 n=1 Tax=Nicotiana tabacum TaxID=4097 RepID=A0AC58SLA5_TOBAC